MAKNKKGFVLYADQHELFLQLTDEQAGKLIKHVFKYVNDEDPQTDDVITNIAFTPIKQQLKRDLKHWESVRQKRSEAGKASANKRQQMSTSVKSVEQTSTKSTVIVKDKVKVKEINIPAYSDFKEYAYSKKKNLDPEALKLKYDSWVDNGWKNGNDKPIKNWKTTLLNTIPYIKTINNHNNIQPQHNLKDLYQ